METLQQRLELIDRHVARCKGALASETKASPVFVAVFNELERKLGKLKAAVAGDPRVTREHLLEAEQAADSMKIAALADPGLTPPTVELATTAHDSLCVLKHEWTNA
jgi:hypothetical protein